MRKYSANDIANMRASLVTILTPDNVPFYQRDIYARVEQQLRTALAAGLSPRALSRQAGQSMRARQETALMLNRHYQRAGGK